MSLSTSSSDIWHRSSPPTRQRRSLGPPSYKRYCERRFLFDFRFNNIQRHIIPHGEHDLFPCHRCKYKFCQKCDIHTCKPSEETKVWFTLGVRRGQIRRPGRITLRWRSVWDSPRWRSAIHLDQMTLMQCYRKRWLPVILTMILWRVIRGVGLLLSIFLFKWPRHWLLQDGWLIEAIGGIDCAIDYGDHWGDTRTKWRGHIAPGTARSV